MIHRVVSIEQQQLRSVERRISCNEYDEAEDKGMTTTSYSSEHISPVDHRDDEQQSHQTKSNNNSKEQQKQRGRSLLLIERPKLHRCDADCRIWMQDNLPNMGAAQKEQDDDDGALMVVWSKPESLAVSGQPLTPYQLHLWQQGAKSGSGLRRHTSSE